MQLVRANVDAARKFPISLTCEVSQKIMNYSSLYVRHSGDGCHHRVATSRVISIWITVIFLMLYINQVFCNGHGYDETYFGDQEEDGGDYWPDDYQLFRTSADHLSNSTTQTESICTLSSDDPICPFQTACGQLQTRPDHLSQTVVRVQMHADGVVRNCSGTMVTDRLVLTSRQCTYSNIGQVWPEPTHMIPAPASSMFVDLGPFSLEDAFSGPRKVVTVARVCRHKQFPYEDPLNRKELALLELSEPIDLSSSHLELACWPYKSRGGIEAQERPKCISAGILELHSATAGEVPLTEEKCYSPHDKLESFNRCWRATISRFEPAAAELGGPILCQDENGDYVAMGVVVYTTFISTLRQSGVTLHHFPHACRSSMIHSANDANLLNYDCTS